MDWQKEQVMTAIALQQAIADTTSQAEAAHQRASQAQESLKDSEEALRDAENDVKTLAVRLQDERLPKAVTSPAYKAAMESIIKEAHAGDLADLVTDRNQIKEHALNCSIDNDNLRTRLGAMKAQANLQAAILAALPSQGQLETLEAIRDSVSARREAEHALAQAKHHLDVRMETLEQLKAITTALFQNPADESQ